jgi:hypothetical protein
MSRFQELLITLGIIGFAIGFWGVLIWSAGQAMIRLA